MIFVALLHKQVNMQKDMCFEMFFLHYLPMFGIVMAFQNFKPAKGFFGSKWVGMENFIYMAMFLSKLTDWVTLLN